MGITLVIVGGIVIISVIAIAGDYITKAKLAKTSIDPDIVKQLERRIGELEQKTQEQDKKIQLLEGDIAFANRLLEDKSR